MIESKADARARDARDDDVSVLGLVTLLLRRWRPIVVFGVAGGLIGLAIGLTSTRLYVSSATFIPQGSEGSTSGLAAAASQFGIRIPSSGGTTWGPPVYVELLRSPVVLEAIARDTIVVAEQGGQRIAVMDLLKTEGASPAERVDAAIRELESLADVHEIRTLGAVKLSVATAWPSVSLSLAEKMLDALNRFNLETRKSQASAERVFVESQAMEADAALRAAERRLQEFRQRNRAISGSPELELEYERLERDVTVRQQLYLSLLQSREEAKIREVRDTPVISILEYPRLAMVGQPRRSVQKAILGGIGGGILGIVLAFAMEWFARARLNPDHNTRQFFEQVQNTVPRFLRRTAR